jgi:phosphate-selective porin OprO/OprP
MRATLPSAALCLLAAAAGVCQEPPRDGGVPARPEASLGQPQATDGRDAEIRELKASLLQIQTRLDQIAGPTDSKAAPGKPAARVSPEEKESSKQEKAAPAGQDDGSSWAMSAEWKNGLQIQSANKDFRVHVGGLLQFDAGGNVAGGAVQFGPEGTGEFQDGALFRRARIRIDGQMYEHFEWIAEFDFANSIENDNGPSTQTIGTPSFVNVWAGVTDVPVLGNLRVGWMKEPISFSHMQSSAALNFMERPPGEGSLGLHSPGILATNWTEDQRVTWAVGFFHAQNDNFGFGFGDGQYAETGRLTCLPVYEDDGRELLHLGVGASHRHLNADQVDLRGRPSVWTMPGVEEPALLSTGTIDGTTQEVVALELAAVSGPWTVQTEYYCTWIHDASVPSAEPPLNPGTLFYQGAYMELLYFLTGEYRAYDRTSATFGRVVPLRDFNIWGGPRGCGAWQVGLRYSYLDLRSGGVPGGTLHDVVFGVNWFLNPNMKVQWNLAADYRESSPPGSDGWTLIGGVRVAVDF